MHHPTEPDKPEILTGPGDEPRAARRTRKWNKTAVIAASALVAALVAGGAGFFLADRGERPAGGAQTGQQPEPQKSDPRLADEEDATVGDVTEEAPQDGSAEENPPQDAVQDPVPEGDAQEPGPRDPGPQTPAKPNPGKPATDRPDSGKPTTPKPGTAPPADNPADGPAGELSGQCAESGC
ncbi:hypothetical protein [Nonomuraea typhae]|uniref:hypothetical protein n=1 Tax=Nonomuraea typhae TaxID=2603600 RepID=UPI0012F75637|nr:hypothetical protein [Nonomuraea typhae]